jgi:amidophosphoribosyltransferase
VHKGNGLVRDVFDAPAMALLEGRVGIAHCRYPTAGSEGSDEAQPFYVNSPYGIALAHNGNLINTDALRREVFEQDRRNVNTESDSEVLLNVFAHELDSCRRRSRRTRVPRRGRREPPRQGRLCGGLRGAGPGPGGVPRPARHPPAGAGQARAARGDEYIVASESVALDILGFERVRDVEPGEGIVITARGELFAQQCAPSRRSTRPASSSTCTSRARTR